MARDTRGPIPYGHSDLRRFSLNPPHWREARRMLAGQSFAATVIGAAGLIGVYVVHPRGTGVYALGLDMTAALSWIVIAVGTAAALATLHRRLAKVFSFTVAVTSLPMVIVSAVATSHHDPGPLGFTAGSSVLYAAFFCANLATGIWLIPNHIEGPAWVHTRKRSADGSDASVRDRS